MKKSSFQKLILELQLYWQHYECTILQPYDVEVAAGTFFPATVLQSVGLKPWDTQYVQALRRPMGSHYALYANRMQYYYQFQVILKLPPNNIQNLHLKSLEQYLDINMKRYDVRFIEDDRESSTLGASGLVCGIWCDEMEISQFTYMQQIGAIDWRPVAGEFTYGLERLALYIQEIDAVKDLDWNAQTEKKALTNGEMDFTPEKQFFKFNLAITDTEILLRHFEDAETQCITFMKENLPMPANA